MTTSLSIKKVAAIAVALSVVFSVAFVSTAKAATSEELQAQISSLLAMIAGLQAQLAGGTTGGTTGGSCTAMQFTLSHKLGQSGGDVMNIQKFLNMDAATMVAASGVGSAGQETAYFGGLSKAAVIKFQNKYASEVLAPVGLSAGTGYWGASSRAKANALEIARCAGSGDGGGTVVVPVTGALTVSAAAQPGNSLAPTNAANVPFTKFTLTAGAAAMTFDSVTVELAGLASKSAFSSVALLDGAGNQVGLTKTLNSNDQATIGETTTVAAGSSQTFTVVGNMGTIGTTYAGQVAAFSVIAVNSSATVAGSLPITGAQHTMNGSLTIGVATAARGVEDPNTSASKEIGTTNYKFQALKITAGSAEELRVKSVRWNQSGSASAGDLANVMLTFDGNTYTPTVSGDYYTFNFGSGVVIAKGLVKEMVLSADIINGSASSIIFDIRKSTDLIVSGETYGYGITPSATAGSASSSTSEFTSGTPWYDGATVTITGGSVNSVSKSNDAPAANVAELVADTVLGAFTIDIKGESITVETVKFAIGITGGDDGDDITNITLVDQNGTVLAGPEDGSATNYTPSGGTASEGSVSFSSVTFPTGETTLFLKGQIGSDLSATDTIIIRVNPTDWTNATGDNTGDTITLASSNSSANTMTVQAGTLTATTLASTPATRSVVAGATDYVWAVATLDAANSGEDVKVTAVIIEDTVSGASSDVNDVLNVEIWADLTSADSVRGDKYETRVADAEQFAATGANTEAQLTMTLDQHITVAKNTSVDIAVVADLSSSATTGAHTHSISLDEAASAVTAVGLTSGSTISVTPSGSGQAQTVATGGTLTTSVDSTSPTAALMLDDTVSEQTIAVFRLASDNVEDLDVDSLKIVTGNIAVSKYLFYNGATKIGEKTNAGTPELSLADGTLTVPANSHVLITVKAVMNDIDGTTVANAASVAVVMDEAQTTGASSGSAVDDTNNRTAATHTMYEAYPVFAFEDVASTVLTTSANYLVAKIKVSNTGTEDMSFDNTATANSLEIQFAGNDATVALDEAITIKDTDGTTLDSGSISSGAVAFDFSTAELVVPAGGSEYIYVYVDASGLATDGDTIQAWLDDGTPADLGFSIGTGTTNYSEADYVFKGDLFGQTHVNP